MSRLPKFIVVLTTFALVLTTLVVLSSAATNSVSVTIGNPDSATRYPFGQEAGADSTAFPNFGAGGVFQQVYDKSAFAGPITITQIAFSSSPQFGSGPGTATYNFDMALSTTSAGPNSLGTNLAANRGANFTPVFSGPVVATLTANNEFDLVVNVTPFTYDPAQGNLLLEVATNSPAQFTGGSVLYFRGGGDSNVGRAYSPIGQGVGVDGSFGVLTRFSGTGVGTAQVTLGNLVQTFDGNPKSVSVTTDPAGLNVDVTYNGSPIAPINAGNYAVSAVVNDPNLHGQANGTLIIQPANQQITFDALSNKTIGDPDFNVSASASSNLAVAFSANGNCTVASTLVHLTGAGSCTITATQGGNGNISAAAPVARTFSIGKLDQQITFDALANKAVDAADFNVSATASSNLAVAFAAGGNCTVAGTLVHLTGAGSCTITATQDGDATFNAAAPVARSFSIGKIDQQITFDALSNKTFGDADFNVSATASSNLTVAFAASGNCTVAGMLVHLGGVGSCTITASQDGDATFNAAAPVARTFSIGKASQQITFDALSNKALGDADFNVSATASSNLAVAFSAGGNCTIAGTQVHLTGAGQCTITASQDGDANYNAAAPVARTFSIGKANQQITFDALSNKTVGDADFNVSATASSNLAVAFAAGGNCTVAGTLVHLTGAGPCTITASQDGDANFNAATPVARTFSIGKTDQQITFDALVNKTVGDADFNVSASASSSLAVAFAAGGNCTMAGTLVHLTGADSCTITASQDGDANFNAAAPVARTFSIGKADQQITFDALSNKTVGDPDFNVSATASSNLAVAFSASGNCTVAGTQVHLTGAGPCILTASQDGDANYSPAATVARSFTIGKADQQITFEALADKKFGDTDFNVSATTSSNLTVSFSAGGNCTIAGAQVHITGVGPCTITASQDGDANYNAAAPVARTFSIGKADQQITFDALANKNVGDADFNVSATASSNLAVAFAASGNCSVAGTLVHLTGVGPCTITASQDGDANYNAAAPIARTFSIGKVDQQITFAALANKNVGNADFNVSATASSNLAVAFAASGNCAVAGTLVHLTGAGSCTIAASQEGDANFNAATPVARTFSIGKTDQQITFEALADKKFGDADFAVAAIASSNLAVSFAASGNCTVSGSQVHLTGAGPCTITASQDGDANNNAAAPVARTFSIGKADQQISFAGLSNKTAGDADFNVSATASSNLAVAFSASGNCTVSGTQVHITGAGQCTITASQGGDSNYNAAPDVPQTFSIAQTNNVAPDAVDDALTSVTEDSGVRTITIASLLANDTSGPADESGQTLTFSLVGSSEVGGTVSSDATNVYFTPAANFNGPASFQYRVTDNGTSNGAPDPKSDTATASFNVSEVNDAPTAVNDTLANVAQGSGVPAIPFSTLTGNDLKGPANESGQTLLVKTVSNPVGGTVSILGGNVIFTPTAAYSGPASFDYTVEDNGTTNGAADTLASGIATASFTITEVNQAPTASNDSLESVAEDSGERVIQFNTLLGNDSKGPDSENGQTLTVTAVSNPVGGTVSIVAGTVRFTPAADYNGPASFQYTIEDNGTTNGAADHKNSTATVSFAITEVNDTPSANGETLAPALQDVGTITIPFAALIANDSKGPADESGQVLVVRAVSNPVGGTVSIADGNVLFSTADGYNGPASFDYTVEDNGTTDGAADPQTSGTATASFHIISVAHTGPVIRFGAANYSVAEGEGFRTITVERTGDTSQPVTIDYASSDDSGAAAFIPCTSPGVGMASSRCDFTTAVGTLRFAAGETSKTFNVLVNQDNYVEGTETLNLTLANPSAGAELGTPATATLEITDDVTEGATNPVDNASDFVRSLYHDILNREPDGPGLAFWTDNIEKCQDPARRPAGLTIEQCVDKQRESTATAFFTSPEFQMTGGFVYRLYKGSLTGFPNYDGSTGRFPTARQFMLDVSRVSEGIVVNNRIDGTVVEANRDRLAKDFVSRPEFDAKYGELNNTLYVEELFNTTGIGQGQFGSGDNSMTQVKQGLVDGLTNGTETRASVLRKIVDGTTVINEGDVEFTTTYGQAFYNQEYRREFVFMEYVGYLRRNPDAAGFVFWLGKLNQFDGDPFRAEMVKSFILSPEYRSRFGQP